MTVTINTKERIETGTVRRWRVILRASSLQSLASLSLTARPFPYLHSLTKGKKTMKSRINLSSLALIFAIGAKCAWGANSSDYIDILNLDFEDPEKLTDGLTSGWVADSATGTTSAGTTGPTFTQTAWVDSSSEATGEHFLLMSRPVNASPYGVYLDFTTLAATANAALSGGYELEYDFNVGGGYGTTDASFMEIAGVGGALFYLSIPGNGKESWGETAQMLDSQGEAVGSGISVRSRGQAVSNAPHNLWYHIKIEGVVGDGVYVTIVRPKTGEVPLKRTKVSVFDTLSRLSFVMRNTKSSNESNYPFYTAFDNVVLKGMPGVLLTEDTVVESSAATSISSEKTPGARTVTTLSESKTWGGISGVGRISSEEDQTLFIGGNASFVGAFMGAMKLTLSGSGTYSILGESSNSGGFAVEGGTLKFALPTSLAGILYNLDASRSDTIDTTTDANENEVTRWKDALGGNYYAVAESYTGGDDNDVVRESINATLTTDYFGGRPSLYSEKFRMVQNQEENQSSVFAVFRLAASGRIMEDASDIYYNSRWYVGRNSSKGRYMNDAASNNAPDNYGAYMGVNGTIGGTAGAGAETVVSIPFHWARVRGNANRKIAYGNGNEMAWAEILSFDRPVTLEEQMAVDSFLMGKWGIAPYKPLGAGPVTVGASGTLDVNGVSAAVGSLTLDGGSLRNAENLTVSGAATFTAGAKVYVTVTDEELPIHVDVLTCESADGLENLTVVVLDGDGNVRETKKYSPIFRNGKVLFALNDGFVIRLH